MYLWFTCALCKNQTATARPRLTPPEAVQFTFLQCREPTWHVLHFGQACWRPLGGLVSLRLKRGPDVELGSASTGAGGAWFTGGCSTDASRDISGE